MDNWKKDLSINDIENHAAKHGERGAKTVKLAARNRDFYNDLQTKGGKFIINELMVLMEVLLDKQLDGNITLEELAEYKAYLNFFNRCSSKFNTFRTAAKKIKEN